ncbi:MAG: DUF2236 domain-containing protein [Gemmatimonadota bacterium]|nr:DUF2236 domain-containing protein [Gemmatimonadota bacterium]
MNSETMLLLGGGRALLMQLAHPVVAAAVADHSDFLADPFGRLWNTLDLTLTVSFGDMEQSRAAAARITEVHRGVVGERKGRAYKALDPDLLLWVHATLVDTALVTHERFVGRMSTAARNRYYEEMKRQAVALGVPTDALPATYPDFAVYLASTLEALRVSEEARKLSKGVLSPRVAPLLVPVIRGLSFVTTGLMPEALREGFGLRWSPRKERLLDAIASGIRLVAIPLLPPKLRRWTHAREAAARAPAHIG